VAGLTLASTNVPQVLGYTRIAAMPVVIGLYTVLLPLVAFAIFGSSRHLVAADFANAAIFSSSLSQMANPDSEKYVELVPLQEQPCKSRQSRKGEVSKLDERLSTTPSSTWVISQ
jgi:sulfate permease, SulP family